MDPRLSAQDVLRCDLCETPVPPMYCDLCHVKLCKACVEEHLSDLSKEHKVVPYKQKGTTPKCLTHDEKLCELRCEVCDLSVCSTCLSSNLHKGHTVLNVQEKIKSKEISIEKDVDELLNSILPKYEEISADIQSEKVNLEKQYTQLTSAVTKQGEEWHREIDIIVNKQKSEINEMKIKHLTILNKKENDVKQIISEVKQCILDLKEILDSHDVTLTSVYKPRNAEFKKLPPKIIISIPIFSPQKINTEQLNHIFSSLSAFGIKTEEQGYIVKSQKPLNCPVVKPVLDEPELITTINTGYGHLFSVTCFSDEEVWTYGDDNIMKLYNLQGKLLKSIRTKSKNTPHDIAVTRSGDLVYTDPKKRIVSIVMNDQIQEVIRLQGWKPLNICSTSSGDLLVTMDSDDKQSKVVRYSGSIEKQTIQFDSEGKPLYCIGDTKYISENRNQDICVADRAAKAVVVVNQAGKLRFKYKGHPSTSKKYSIDPCSITTDSQSQILTADSLNYCIHILDQDGQFLCYIDDSYFDLMSPWGLCVDTKDRLFVAEYQSGKLKKIKYM